MARTVLFLAALVFAAGATAQRGPSVIGSYDTGYSKGAEIISVQQSSMRAALTIGSKGQVDILSLKNPGRPARLNRIDVLADGDADVSSVAFHPSEDYVAVAVIAADPWQKGRVELYSASRGEKLAAIEAGYWPDSVMFSKDGRWLAVANEGEPFVYDRSSKQFSTPPGSITLIDMKAGYLNTKTMQIALPDLTGVEGVIDGRHKRLFEREVDITGNGRIDDEADFNGDGSVEKAKVKLGVFAGVAVTAKEHKGEEINIPLTAGTADQLEPEYLAFSPDGSELFVSLQENNAVIVVNTAQARVARRFGLGISRHKADVDDDGSFNFVDDLVAFREPDGIALSSDGRLLLTADEGDTEPKASKLNNGEIAGGSRTLSVFDARTGKLLGDTGSQLDEMACAAGVYPDDRSDNKGAEPESVVYLSIEGKPYAAVTLERADAIAMVDLSRPSEPQVQSVTPLRQVGDTVKAFAPEGLALFSDSNGDQYLLCANEKSGTVTVLKL